jgi:dihydroorotase
MTNTYDKILKNGTVVLPEGIIKTNIAILNEKIVDIGALDTASATEIIDCSGLHILPGVIDTQVQEQLNVELYSK